MAADARREIRSQPKLLIMKHVIMNSLVVKALFMTAVRSALKAKRIRSSFLLRPLRLLRRFPGADLRRAQRHLGHRLVIFPDNQDSGALADIPAEAMLQIEVEHHFTIASVSVWFDDHLVYEQSLRGGERQAGVSFPQSGGAPI